MFLDNVKLRATGTLVNIVIGTHFVKYIMCTYVLNYDHCLLAYAGRLAIYNLRMI